MSTILSKGDRLKTVSSGMECVVGTFLGSGGQGEVHTGDLAGTKLAVKWYYPPSATDAQWDILGKLADWGPPSDRFLWPLDRVVCEGAGGFGYLMPLRDQRYHGISSLLLRKVETTFRALATASLQLAHSFMVVHAKGLCYRDISHGNIFFDPATGDVLICDNDNVAVDGQAAGILGTPRFMAPEVVNRKTLPTTQTDLHSLAVLLFLMLINHHPLEGAKEAAIHALDLPAMNKLYGTDPIFIFDPNNRTNSPVAGLHDNAILLWPLYPGFIRRLFIQAFTDGLRDPLHGRVRETVWRSAAAQLLDSIVYCAHCGTQNFADVEVTSAACWRCARTLAAPLSIRIGKRVVVLNHDTKLYAHHLKSMTGLDFGSPVAEVSRHPADPNRWGLKNLGTASWTAGDKQVEPGRSVGLVPGIQIAFPDANGVIEEFGRHG